MKKISALVVLLGLMCQVSVAKKHKPEDYPNIGILLSLKVTETSHNYTVTVNGDSVTCSSDDREMDCETGSGVDHFLITGKVQLQDGSTATFEDTVDVLFLYNGLAQDPLVKLWNQPGDAQKQFHYAMSSKEEKATGSSTEVVWPAGSSAPEKVSHPSQKTNEFLLVVPELGVVKTTWTHGRVYGINGEKKYVLHDILNPSSKPENPMKQ